MDASAFMNIVIILEDYSFKYLSIRSVGITSSPTHHNNQIILLSSAPTLPLSSQGANFGDNRCFIPNLLQK